MHYFFHYFIQLQRYISYYKEFCSTPFPGHGNLSLKDLLMFAQRDYVTICHSKLTIGPTLDTASIFTTLLNCLIVTLVICFSLGIKGLANNGLGWPLYQHPISISFTTLIITSSLWEKEVPMCLISQSKW